MRAVRMTYQQHFYNIYFNTIYHIISYYVILYCIIIYIYIGFWVSILQHIYIFIYLYLSVSQFLSHTPATRNECPFCKHFLTTPANTSILPLTLKNQNFKFVTLTRAPSQPVALCFPPQRSSWIWSHPRSRPKCSAQAAGLTDVGSDHIHQMTIELRWHQNRIKAIGDSTPHWKYAMHTEVRHCWYNDVTACSQPVFLIIALGCRKPFVQWWLFLGCHPSFLGPWL